MTEVTPGLYLRGQVDYAAIKAVNFSTLKEMAVSPKRYRHRLKNARATTGSMFRGTAAHTAILEPNRFMLDYAMYEGKRRAGKDWAAFCDANKGKQILKKDEFMLAMAMRDAVRGDQVSAPYLEDGDPEVALVWDDKETGVRCKGRIDWLTSNVIVDIKSSKSIEPFPFWRYHAALLTHMQAAFYFDGYQQAMLKEPLSKIIAVEFGAPHDVIVYNMTDEVLDKGREEYRCALIRLLECERNKSWPGYARGLEIDAALPAWMMNEDDDMGGLDLDMSA